MFYSNFRLHGRPLLIARSCRRPVALSPPPPTPNPCVTCWRGVFQKKDGGKGKGKGKGAADDAATKVQDKKVRFYFIPDFVSPSTYPTPSLPLSASLSLRQCLTPSTCLTATALYCCICPSVSLHPPPIVCAASSLRL